MNLFRYMKKVEILRVGAGWLHKQQCQTVNNFIDPEILKNKMELVGIRTQNMQYIQMDKTMLSISLGALPFLPARPLIPYINQ